MSTARAGVAVVTVWAEDGRLLARIRTSLDLTERSANLESASGREDILRAVARFLTAFSDATTEDPGA